MEQKEKLSERYFKMLRAKQLLQGAMAYQKPPPIKLPCPRCLTKAEAEKNARKLNQKRRIERRRIRTQPLKDNNRKQPPTSKHAGVNSKKGPKRKIVWTQEMTDYLRECDSRARDEHKRICSEQLEKVALKTLILAEWDKVYRHLNISYWSLCKKLGALRKQRTTTTPNENPSGDNRNKDNMKSSAAKSRQVPPRFTWTDDLTNELIECWKIAIHQCQIIKDECNVRVPVYDMVFHYFNEIHPNMVMFNQIRTKLYNLKRTKKLQLPDINDTSTFDEIWPSDDETDNDMDTIINAPPNFDLRSASNYYNLGKKHASQKLFNGVCANCGMLLYGDAGKGHLYHVSKKSAKCNTAPILKRYKPEDILYEYETEDKYFCCYQCHSDVKNGDGFSYDYALRPPDQYPEYDMPNCMANLTEKDKRQIALGNIFSTTLRKANLYRKEWEHKIGEVNISLKPESSYEGMIGFITEQNSSADESIEQTGSNTDVDSTELNEEQENDNDKNVKECVKWLHKNNNLYTDFFSNRETLYAHFNNENHHIADHHVLDAKGNALSTHLESESSGLNIPFTELTNLPRIPETEDIAAVQHPRNRISETKAFYADQKLEAKIFPNLFPYGMGSWKAASWLKYSEYVKKRLLNMDGRFRHDRLWSFYMLDRHIKRRLISYARLRKVAKHKLSNTLTVSDVLEEETEKTGRYDKYGQEVPNSIPGCKSYWSSKLLNLLAMSRELGQPDFFITLTQVCI